MVEKHRRLNLSKYYNMKNNEFEQLEEKDVGVFPS